MSFSRQVASNIVVITNQEVPLANLVEIGYWTRILACLRAELGDEAFHRYYFQLVFSNSVPLEAKSGHPNIFLIADEHQTLRPALYDGKNVVFQSYYSAAVFKKHYDKLVAFPLGYSDKLNLEQAVPFAERTVNVFFSGNLHRGRRRMFNYYSYLRHLPFALQHRLQARIGSVYDHKYPQSVLRFTSGFMQGLGPEEYANLIKNSKIVLTPHGSVSEECFRHYEAMKAGCIIVSERLPDNHFFAGSPVIQIDDWREGDTIIKQLLRDPVRMQALHEAALRWWHDVMAEPAVARYMAAILHQESPLVGENNQAFV